MGKTIRPKTSKNAKGLSRRARTQGSILISLKAMTAAAHVAEHATDNLGTMIAKAAPPASVSIFTLAGVPLSDLVLLLTAIYTVMMILHKAWQMWRDFRGGKSDD